MADVDVDRLNLDRFENSSFHEGSVTKDFRHVTLKLGTWQGGTADLLSRVAPRLFVHADVRPRAEHCEEIFRIQTMGLVKRLRHTRAHARSLSGFPAGLI